MRKIDSFHQRVIGLNERNIEYVQPNNPRKYYPLADDKILTKEILIENGIKCPETYTVVSSLGEVEAKMEVLNRYENVVIKPGKGSQGGGILVLKREGSTWTSGSGKQVSEAQIKQHIANILFGVHSFGSNDRAIIEYCIQQHDSFQKIYPKGVADLRIVMLKNNPMMAMVRFPTDESDGKANLHQGAIGVGVDMATGEMKKAFDGDRYFGEHPDTHSPIEGVDLPMWEDTLNLAQKTSELFPLDFLGIDIVYDQNFGPMIMEINVRPGLQIQNVNQKGLKEI